MGIWGKGESPKPIVWGITKWRDGFEGPRWDDMFLRDLSRWSSFTQDNGSSLELSKANVKEGSQSLRCEARPGAKCCIEKQQLGFKAGMDFWCSFWLYVAGAPTFENLVVMDLESTEAGGAGRRLFFKGNPNHLILESKHAGTTFRQQVPAVFPMDQWVDIAVHYSLVAPGQAWLYQDGKLVVLGASGSLMPDAMPGATYDRLQVGVTKNDSKTDQLVYVDDVRIGQTAGEV